MDSEWATARSIAGVIMPGSCSSRLRKSAQDDKWSFCLTASYDLQDYSIVNLAFPQRSQTGPGAVPDNINLQGQEDNIYVQGQEDGVVYSLVWNPAKIKAMLCEIVRKQNGDQVPKMNAANPYLSPLMKEDEYMPREICKR